MPNRNTTDERRYPVGSRSVARVLAIVAMVITLLGVSACAKPSGRGVSSLAATAAAPTALPVTPTALVYRPAVVTPTASPTSEADAPIAVLAKDGIVRVPATGLADGRARFYAHQIGEHTIPFFLLQSSDGVIRAAFDACDVCYPAKLGYRQEGNEMVCNNCGSRFPSVKINVEVGGCNPSPLTFEMQDGSIIIQVDDLSAGARFF